MAIFPHAGQYILVAYFIHSSLYLLIPYPYLALPLILFSYMLTWGSHFILFLGLCIEGKKNLTIISKAIQSLNYVTFYMDFEFLIC